MTIKERLLQELESAPDDFLEQVLQFVLEHKRHPPEPEDEIRAQVWQAYLDSVQQYEEVYRRLANS